MPIERFFVKTLRVRLKSGEAVLLYTVVMRVRALEMNGRDLDLRRIVE